MFREDKALVLDQLFRAYRLMRAGSDIRSMELERDGDTEVIIVKFENGGHRIISVTGDSGAMLAEDMVKHIDIM